MLIAAAMMAASRMPATNAGNTLFTISTNTICCAEAGSSFAASDCVTSPFCSRNVRPRMATAIAAPSDSTTQMQAIQADFLTSFGSLMPMNRTRMCGIPK